jgi:hypothetical protein
VTQLLAYVDTSAVREGAIEELKEAIDELVEFVEANVPDVLAYSVYLSQDGNTMTVVHVHADPRSLERHLEVGGPAFRRFAALLTLASIHVYGEPTEKTIRMLHEKARVLGGATVTIHSPRSGFTRFAPR